MSLLKTLIQRSFIGQSLVCEHANLSSSCQYWSNVLTAPHLHSRITQMRCSSHLNEAADLPVIKLPVYYKEGMRKLKGSIRNEELEQFRRDSQKGNIKVPVIRCRAKRLAHHDGQVYDHNRVSLATYRWRKMNSAGQYFIIRPFAKNQDYQEKTEEAPISYLSGHIEQKFIRVGRTDRPDMLVNLLKKINKLTDDSGKTPFVAVYSRKLSTASYLEMVLNKEKLYSKVVKTSMSHAANQLFMQELRAMDCNILLKLDSSHNNHREMDDIYQETAEKFGFVISHIINYDCPDSLDVYESRFEDITHGEVLLGKKRTVTTFVRFKLEAELAQTIEKRVRLNT